MTTKLEQAARQLLEHWDSGDWSETTGFIEALREALAEKAEQEPVAWRCRYCKTDMPTEHASDCPIERFGLPNEYAAPVRTKDLTDDEIAAVTGYRKSGATWPVVEEVARAVIAADREKNK